MLKKGKYMKTMNVKSIYQAHLAIIFVGVLSNGCAGLMGLMGGMGGLMGGGGGGSLPGNNTPQFQGLTEQTPTGELMLDSPDVAASKTGFVVKSVGSISPNADGSAVYGLFVLADSSAKPGTNSK
jgi:hypothetical protein